MASYELAEQVKAQIAEEQLVCCGNSESCEYQYSQQICQAFGVGVAPLPDNTLENRLRGVLGLEQKVSDEYSVVVYLKTGARLRSSEYRDGVKVQYVPMNRGLWYDVKQLFI